MSSRDFIPKPESFSGANGQDPEAWLNFLERYHKCKQLPDEMFTSTFALYMKEIPLDWYDALSENCQGVQKIAGGRVQETLLSNGCGTPADNVGSLETAAAGERVGRRVLHDDAEDSQDNGTRHRRQSQERNHDWSQTGVAKICNTDGTQNPARPAANREDSRTGQSGSWR